MDTLTPKRLVYSEVDIQIAILALKDKAYVSIRKAAVAFNVPCPTLRRRISGRDSRATKLPIKNSNQSLPRMKARFRDRLHV